MKTLALPRSVRRPLATAHVLPHIARRARTWLQALWHQACQHAERPDRVVPYC